MAWAMTLMKLILENVYLLTIYPYNRHSTEQFSFLPVNQHNWFQYNEYMYEQEIASGQARELLIHVCQGPSNQVNQYILFTSLADCSGQNKIN